MIVVNQAPAVKEFMQLRESTGWGSVDLAMAQLSLKQSLFHVCYRDNDELVGMGRVVGDGAMYFYVQDVVVAPEYQGRGIGHQLMQAIEQYLATAAKPGATIGLLAAKGKEGFYKRYRYIERTGEELGLGMCRFVKPSL